MDNNQKKQWLVISFINVTEAMRSEKLFLHAGSNGTLIPTPRQISASCGICWRADLTERSMLESVIEKEKIMTDQINTIEM